jgi:hypothetical protein
VDTDRFDGPDWMDVGMGPGMSMGTFLINALCCVCDVTLTRCQKRILLTRRGSFAYMLAAEDGTFLKTECVAGCLCGGG